MEFAVPPFLPFFVGALIVAILRGRLQAGAAILVPVLGFANLWYGAPGPHETVQVLDYTLVLVRADDLSMLFGWLFHIAAFIGLVYSSHLRDTVQQVAALVYAGSALGAVFAGDFITLFVFWELLAVSSVFLIWARRTPRAIAAGFRYLLVNVFAGVVLLAGALVRLWETGSLEFSYIGLEAGFAGWLILLALGVKAAFPFLHNWLTDAYPEATPTGTVFLSAFTTKVAVYALARAYPGTELLVYVGATMAMFPIFYAVIENDLRRVLAYSMINQIGFMVCGIGIGTALALNGAVSHAFNDVIFKGLLMMSMGAVLHMTGRINGSELGGLYKSMPITTVLCIVGAASISAFPLFSGFVSKSMVMQAAMDEGYPVIWLALLFASAGVFHHAGIKIPFFAFFAHDSGIRTTEPPINMLLAMGIAATLCIGIGSYPDILYGLLPYEAEYHPYDWSHVITQTQLLFFSALAFVWLNLTGRYPPELPGVNIDAEWLYRRLAPRIVGRAVPALDHAGEALGSYAKRQLDWAIAYVHHHHGPDSRLAGTWTTGSLVALIALLLVASLAFYLS
ncbi:MAG: Na(+)/H(+) antiporter subunit D [Rhodospirillaceae bacterium]|jgi:multicomponent Na+:H+ antiporter subunit D|nr:Na(+)/H(+) antiporter subunit D [Rhodospirillaceae bacterium]MBT6118438.1 Na(+)/H(+) antiporter subunit D [Rhodospirillaceae bacterium]